MDSLGSLRGPVHPGAPGGGLGLSVGQERRECDETIGTDGKVGVLGEGIAFDCLIFKAGGDNFLGKDQVAMCLGPRRGERGYLIVLGVVVVVVVVVVVDTKIFELKFHGFRGTGTVDDVGEVVEEGPAISELAEKGVGVGVGGAHALPVFA